MDRLVIRETNSIKIEGGTMFEVAKKSGKTQKNLRRYVVRSLALVGILGMGSIATACGSSSTSAKTSPTSPKMTVDMVVGAVANGFYVKASEGARQEAKQLGVKLDFTGSRDFTQPAETTVLNTLIASKPAALVVAPVDPTGIVPALKRWVSNKIPIATFDSTISGPIPVVTRVATHNFAGGEAAAKALGKLIGGKGEVATIGLNTSDVVLARRQEGFIHELHTHFPGIHVVAQELVGSDSSSIPESDTENLISKYPNLKAIFGTSDVITEAEALGVEQVSKRGVVKVVGFDGGPKLYSLVQSNAVQILMQQRPAQEAALALKAVVEAARHQKVTVPKQYDFYDIEVTPQNVQTMRKYMY